MHTQLVFAVGDLHGDWAALNVFMDVIRTSEEIRVLAKGCELEVILLQCGDFGYFPHSLPASTPALIDNSVDFIQDGRAKIYWADGNHEDHDALDALERAHHGEPFIEVAPYVFFAPFGSLLTLIDGTNVMFAGGAESCDKQYRIEGKSWWRQEGIDAKDMARLPSPDSVNVDWVVSHASPMGFQLYCFTIHSKVLEQSRKQLEIIRTRYRPTRWFHGHYHEHMRGRYEGCEWTCLNYAGSDDVWVEEIGILMEKPGT